MHDQADAQHRDCDPGLHQPERGNMRDRHDDRSRQQHRHRDLVEGAEEARQHRAQGKKRAALGMLDRVRDLMGGNRDRRDRTAIVIFGRETHSAGIGIVMVARGRALHRNRAEIEAVKQMPGEFAAGSRQVGTGGCMSAHLVAHPSLRPEDQEEDDDGDESVKHCSAIAPAAPPVTTATACGACSS